jgi:GNAT superfamily N-acetyltransferase
MTRAATIEDVPALTELGRAFFLECPNWRSMRFNAERFAQAMVGLIESERGFVQIAESHGAIIGAFIALADEHWCCDDILVHELALYVDRAHRGGMTGARLIRDLIEWKERIGAKGIKVAASTGIDNEGVARLYEIHGFHRVAIGLEH